jgi:hypothetical protein
MGQRAGVERRRRGGAQRWRRHSDGCGGSEAACDIRTRGMRMTWSAEEETGEGAASPGKMGVGGVASQNSECGGGSRCSSCFAGVEGEKEGKRSARALTREKTR